jgi:hypothetical protein
VTITLTPSKATYVVGEIIHVTVTDAAAGIGSNFVITLFQNGGNLADVDEGTAALTFTTDFLVPPDLVGQSGLSMHAAALENAQRNPC